MIVPNKLVARVVWEEAETVAEKAKKALLSEWTRIADTAKNRLMRQKSFTGCALDDIWTRQSLAPWEIYWAAAMESVRIGRLMKKLAVHWMLPNIPGCFEACEEAGV